MTPARPKAPVRRPWVVRTVLAWSRAVNYPRRELRGARAWVPTRLQAVSAAFIGAGGFLILTALWLQLLPVPRPNTMAAAQLSRIEWHDGGTIAAVGIANRSSVPLSSMPVALRAAVIAAEDRGFYDHAGFSVRGISRALFSNVTGGTTEGGSTITQQYAKNAYLSHDRTIVRKVRELFLAVKLETRVNKDQILQDYLNTIWFGRNSYGVEEAAMSYFNKPVQRLDIPQSVVLAALLRAPALYDPVRHPERLRKRWDYVLDSMVQMRTLRADVRARLAFPAVAAQAREQRYAGPRGHLLVAVQQELLRDGFTQREIDLGGLQVRTTFDATVQSALEQAISERAPRSNMRGVRIGAVAVRPGTGEVAAMYGGADYLANQLNNATDAIGQAGSTFKPFALAAALEDGISLQSTWDGNSGARYGSYRVRNFGGESFGRTTLLNGTIHSVNTVYVGVTQRVGPQAVVDAAVRAGIPPHTPSLEPVLSVPLGTCSPHAIDMAAAYATFAAHGVRATPSMISEVRDARGKVVWRHKVQTRRAFAREVADTVTSALQRVVWYGTGAAANRANRSVAGKTGTTNENKAAWFVGYTPSLAAAVMFTKEDASGMPVSLNGTGGLGSFTGGSFPARIWGTWMRDAYRGVPDEKFDLQVIRGAGVWAGGGSGSTPSADPSATATDGSGSVSPTDMPTGPTDAPSVPTDSGVPTEGSGSSEPSTPAASGSTSTRAASTLTPSPR
ncbi:MAG: penicillin-binding protein [Actinomycetales bacterium]|nr:penicillin-binding protein [Actinomycetales bacterium]